MRRVLPGAVLAAALLGGATTGAQARYVGSVGLLVGAKWLSSTDWSPVDRQDEIGVTLAFEDERAPIWFALDVLDSRGSARTTSAGLGPTSVSGSTTEYAIGVRKVWGRHLVRPFLGGGGLIVAADTEERSAVGTIDRSDTSVGFWIDGGVAFRLRSGFETGIDVRYSRANVDLGRGFEDIQRSAGGVHGAVVLGYGW